MQQKEVYYFEVGVRCDEQNDEAREMEKFKFKFKILDENFGETKTFQEAYNYVIKYVENGVIGTYGVIEKVVVDEEEYDGICNGMSDSFNYQNFFNGKLLLSIYKKNDKIVTVYNYQKSKGKKTIIQKIKEDINWLGFDYDRLSSSGQELYDEIVSLINKL